MQSINKLFHFLKSVNQVPRFIEWTDWIRYADIGFILLSIRKWCIYATLSQILIGRSILSWDKCKLISWYRILIIYINMPYCCCLISSHFIEMMKEINRIAASWSAPCSIHYFNSISPLINRACFSVKLPSPYVTLSTNQPKVLMTE